ncbi:MAG: acetamidase/formamidase family protein [Chloroflexota bacterium]
MPTTHILRPERRTLHGHFSRDLEPVLTIQSGDTVQFTTLDSGWGMEPFVGGEYYHHRRVFENRDPKLDDGHALTGPIAIEGAKPGMTLEIQIKDIQLGAWGFCLGGGWPSAVNKRLNITSRGIVHAWQFDKDRMIGRNHLGHTAVLRPFMGVMGMPPDEAGIHSTIPPRVCGGNLDCKELVVGSTLYLPIAVAGGLFSTGDGHAAQGDGEIGGTAIEAPMDLVELTFRVRDDFPVTTPVANTPAGWITMGFDTSLNEAAFMAIEAIFSLMEKLYQLDRWEVVALASHAVDLHITQIVNELGGVHAILPHGRVR